MKADRKYTALFSLLTKYTLITGLLFHFSAIDFNPNISDNNIEVVDDTNEGDEKDTEEKELFLTAEKWPEELFEKLEEFIIKE